MSSIIASLSFLAACRLSSTCARYWPVLPLKGQQLQPLAQQVPVVCLEVDINLSWRFFVSSYSSSSWRRVPPTARDRLGPGQRPHTCSQLWKMETWKVEKFPLKRKELPLGAPKRSPERQARMGKNRFSFSRTTGRFLWRPLAHDNNLNETNECQKS